MRHRNGINKLNRNTAQRKALKKNMCRSMILHEKIKTTDIKAKVIRSDIEKLITLAKKGDLHSRRQAFSILGDKEAVHKLFTEIGPRFAERNGGYTRIIKLADRRLGDAAPMAVIEFTEQAPSA